MPYAIERPALSVLIEDRSGGPFRAGTTETERFPDGMRRRAADTTFLSYVALPSAGEEIHARQPYHQFPPWLNPMPQSDSDAGHGS